MTTEGEGAMLQEVVTAIALGLAVSASAHATPLDEPPGFDPRVMTVVAPGRVHFVRIGDGCPATGPACAASAYVLAGDEVVAIGTDGEWVQAVFTSGAPHFRSTFGWLPRAALAESGGAAGRPADWAGTWESGDQKQITVKPMQDHRAEVVGNATWGGDDPGRVARGGVNIGYFDTTIVLHGAVVTFTPSWDDGHPAVMDPPPDIQDCVLRLRQLGSYLVADDNGACGGMNVTFTGVYRRDARN
jgi:hypothetical protein